MRVREKIKSSEDILVWNLEMDVLRSDEGEYSYVVILSYICVVFFCSVYW